MFSPYSFPDNCCTACAALFVGQINTGLTDLFSPIAISHLCIWNVTYTNLCGHMARIEILDDTIKLGLAKASVVSY